VVYFAMKASINEVIGVMTSLEKKQEYVESGVGKYDSSSLDYVYSVDVINGQPGKATEVHKILEGSAKYIAFTGAPTLSLSKDKDSSSPSPVNFDRIEEVGLLGSKYAFSPKTSAKNSPLSVAFNFETFEENQEGLAKIAFSLPILRDSGVPVICQAVFGERRGSLLRAMFGDNKPEESKLALLHGVQGIDVNGDCTGGIYYSLTLRESEMSKLRSLSFFVPEMLCKEADNSAVFVAHFGKVEVPFRCSLIKVADIEVTKNGDGTTSSEAHPEGENNLKGTFTDLHADTVHNYRGSEFSLAELLAFN